MAGFRRKEKVSKELLEIDEELLKSRRVVKPLSDIDIKELHAKTENQSKLQSQYGDQVVNLKSNKLSKSLVILERIFNSDDEEKDRAANLAARKDDYILVTDADGKILNLGKVCFESKQEAFVNLC